jgi:hypothetical protein
VVQGGAQYVSVVHALRRCGNRSEIHSFIGDTHPPRLPTIKLEPKNGLKTYLRPSYKYYCDGDRVNTFYDSQPEDSNSFHDIFLVVIVTSIAFDLLINV